MSVIEEIQAERQRQIAQEGWSTDHDDQHNAGEMALAAAAYATHTALFRDADEHGHNYAIKVTPLRWPWDPEWWKPKNRAVTSSAPLR